MLTLVPPTVDLRESWQRARAEWPAGHQDGSGLHADDDVETQEGFAAWVARLGRQADPAVAVPAGQVHSTRWWIVEDDEYLGVVELRHELTPHMVEGVGHIGYSVRPSARRRGVATWALATVLERATALELSRVLVTCDADNIPSTRTIESNGGVLEDVRATERGRKRRYWIDLRR